MKVLPRILTKLSPLLKEKTAYELADALIDLGFEAEVLEGETQVLDIEVTPNRGDAMSHLGIARDLSAYFGAEEALVFSGGEKINKIPDSAFLTISTDDDLVSQYHGLIIENIKIIESPNWLKEELSLLGIKPINNIVDLTNYLMELYGQPLHAFDLYSLSGRKINFRASKKDEKIETISGIIHKLPAGVIIGEDSDKIVDLAGIQGGAISEVIDSTNAIFLQSAIFNKSAIRIASKKLATRTDASVRYERGIDPKISLSVLESFCNFVETEEFGGAKVTGKILTKTDNREPEKIEFNPSKINHLLGTEISRANLEKYLKSLGLLIEGELVTPPSWRLDISICQDLAEEVMRLEGLNANIPTQKLPSSKLVSSQSDWEWAEILKDILLSLDFTEIQTQSFVSAKDLTFLGFSKENPLLNPLNPDLEYLRPSLVFGAAKVIAQNPWFDPIQIFEVGHIISDSEKTNLLIAVSGRVQKIEEILRKLALRLSIDEDKLVDVGSIIEFDQELKDSYKIRKKYAAAFEISLEELKKLKPQLPDSFNIDLSVPNYLPVSKFPPSTRDASIVLDNDISFADLKDYILKFNNLIENVILLDEFSHEKFGFNKKSITFRIFYSDTNETLGQEKVDSLNNKLLGALEKSFEVIIR